MTTKHEADNIEQRMAGVIDEVLSPLDDGEPLAAAKALRADGFMHVSEAQNPTRIEVIDHRTNAHDVGRLAPKHIILSWQDDGRTLKIFLVDNRETYPK